QTPEVKSPNDLERVLTLPAAQRPDAVVVLASSSFYPKPQRSTLIAGIARYRVPAIGPFVEFAQEGGLISYGPNIPEMFHHCASFVDKILKGAKPGDLPVEQPTKFELVINLKTAKALGLTLPPSLLPRTDQAPD